MKQFTASILAALPLMTLLGYLISIWHEATWERSGGEVQGFIFLFILISLNIVMIFGVYPLIKNQLLKRGKLSLTWFIFSVFISTELAALAIVFSTSLYYGMIADTFFYLVTPLMASIPAIVFAAIWCFLVIKSSSSTTKEKKS